MRTSILKELTSYILDRINDRVIDNDNIDDWHHICFNEDYYVIGYYQAEEWIKMHEIGVFEAMSICREYEMEHFGEARHYDNAESLVNMLVCVYGYDIIHCQQWEGVEELKSYIENV